MATTGLSCMWGGAGGCWPPPSAFKHYMRYNNAESPQFMDRMNQNSAIVMSGGAQNMSGEQSQDANTLAMNQLKETV